MKSKDLSNRLLTSIVLISLLALSFNYSYILIISLIFVSLISWIEFQGLISKIFKKKSIRINFYRITLNGLSLIYLTMFSAIIFSIYAFTTAFCASSGISIRRSRLSVSVIVFS